MGAHFILFPFLGAVVLIYIFLTQFWFIGAAYLAWYVYDAKTPQQGGRYLPVSRTFKAWENLRDYFPIKLYKDGELDPAHNYLLGYHPHGITVYGAFVNFGVCATGFSDMFPGVMSRLLTIETYYKFPFFRDYIMFSGLCNVHRDSYRSLLGGEKKGIAACVVPGGAEESLECDPGKMTIILKSRRGFVKMALRTGAHLVPVISFGENEVYKQVPNPRGSLLRKLQTNLMGLISFAPPIFYGWKGTIIPFKKPINTVVGAPIPLTKVDEPSWPEVCELHEKYMIALRELFEKYKTKFGYPEDYELEIL